MKKILLLLFLVVLAMQCIACSSTENADNGNQTDGGNQAVSIYELYANTGSMSFAMLTITSVRDDVYVNKEIPEHHYLILECIVEEDFYGIMESEKTISLPIILNLISTTYYDAEEVKEWVLDYDCILAYYYKTDDIFGVKKIDTDEVCDFSNLCSPCKLNYINILPVKNNKIDLENQYYRKEAGYTYDRHKDYLEYIKDGMTLENVSKNIRNLANEAKI